MAAASRRSRLARNSAADDPLAPVRVKRLVSIFGAVHLAAMLGVNRSQPTQWISGAERPGARTAPLFIDLEHIVARARLVWGDKAAVNWLNGTNSYLSGAKPIDVSQLEGPARGPGSSGRGGMGIVRLMLVYRVFPYLAAAKKGAPGHPLYEHHPRRGGRIDHPLDR